MAAVLIAVVVSVLALMVLAFGGLVDRFTARRTTLTAVRAELGITTAAALTEKDDRIAAVIDGMTLTVALVERDAGETNDDWTELDIALPRLPLSLELRPETDAERRRRDRGLVVDLITGDAGFDAAFIVEAAPSALVLAALDAPMRDQLRGLGEVTVSYDPKRGLRAEALGWADPSTILTRVRVLAALAARLEAALPALEAVAPDGGAPYRGDDGAGAAVRAAAASDERARLDDVRRRRAVAGFDTAVARLVLVVLMTVIAMLGLAVALTW